MTRRAPNDCNSMAELRVQIDALDQELVALLAARADYIDRAATLKKSENLPANIPERVAQVLDKVTDHAKGQGLDAALVRQIWTVMIEWSIAREEKQMG